MTTDNDFDRQIQAYLESGPAELADRVLVAARAQLKTTRRRRSGFAWPAPWRNGTMNPNARLLLAGGGALAAVIGAGVLGASLLRQDASPGTSTAPPAPRSSGSPLSASPDASSSPDSSPSLAPLRAPAWTPTGGMTTARARYTATLLLDGKVLVAGGVTGQNGERSASSAELYDPSTGSWTPTGSMHGARDGQTATRLPDGRVLVVGGAGRAGMGALTTAELYDPLSGAWTPTGDTLQPARGHTATLLANGKVLMVGGDNPTAAEVYDPASGTWTATLRPKVRYHVEHTATLLPDGRVLVAGGPPNGRDIGWPTAELYDPRNGSWTVTGNMVRIRVRHSATLLPDGTVLVVGGQSLGGTKTEASAEVYDPTSGTWTAAGGKITIGAASSPILLPDGLVLVAGGYGEGGGFVASVATYDPVTQAWTALPSMETARGSHTATLLPSGQVLVAGGLSVIDGTAQPQTSAELFDPGNGR
jgi:Kelch motif protein/galactose oxidase-like protein